jgi:ribosomal protein S18 acetylase RimI-like enzyme
VLDRYRMKTNIEIRKYKKSDLESAINVYKNLCAFYEITIHDIEEIKKFFSVRNYFEQYYTPCAFDLTANKVIGLAFTEIITEETQQVSGYIKLIYVEESYRHQGIMTALINNAIDYFKEIPVDQVRIYLHNKNLPYLSYYSDKLGFSPIITIVEKSLKQK